MPRGVAGVAWEASSASIEHSSSPTRPAVGLGLPTKTAASLARLGTLGTPSTQVSEGLGLGTTLPSCVSFLLAATILTGLQGGEGDHAHDECTQGRHGVGRGWVGDGGHSHTGTGRLGAGRGEANWPGRGAHCY